MMLHVESAPITAAQITANCPAKLNELGQHIAAHLEKAERCDQKADDHRLTAGRLLAQARELCDDSGFTAFHERFCPNLGRSRTYDLLAIASGKKSAEQIRADNAERNKRLRQRKKATEIAVRHVTESCAKSVASRPTTAEKIAKAEAQKARAEAVTRLFPPETKRIPSESREALIKALQGLAAESVADRAAAKKFYKQNSRLNLFSNCLCRLQAVRPFFCISRADKADQSLALPCTSVVVKQ